MLVFKYSINTLRSLFNMSLCIIIVYNYQFFNNFSGKYNLHKLFYNPDNPVCFVKQRLIVII